MEYGAALARIAEVSTQSDGEPHATERIVEETAALFDTGMASIFQFRRDGSLKHMAGIGVPTTSIRKFEEPSNSKHVSSLLEKSPPPVITQLTQENIQTEVGGWADLLSVATMAFVPLGSDSTKLGVLILYHKSPYDYTQDELALLRVVSVLVTPVVARGTPNKSEHIATPTSQLFNVLSHELRTPLTSIMGFTQLIRKRLSASAHADRRTIEQLDMLWAQAQRLNRLIDTFVDLNRIERGEFEITRGQVEITGLLRAAAQGQSQAGARHIISMNVPDEPVWVHGDSKRLEQVFNHILANALRYAPVDRPVEISCEADSGEGTVTVRIADRGPGIPTARLKEIFNRKYPGGPLKTDGLGVGLYMSKVIVEAHGGRISIESSSAKGTVVEIVLPA